MWTVPRGLLRLNIWPLASDDIWGGYGPLGCGLSHKKQSTRSWPLEVQTAWIPVYPELNKPHCKILFPWSLNYMEFHHSFPTSVKYQSMNTSQHKPLCCKFLCIFQAQNVLHTQKHTYTHMQSFLCHFVTWRVVFFFNFLVECHVTILCAMWHFPRAAFKLGFSWATSCQWLMKEGELVSSTDDLLHRMSNVKQLALDINPCKQH